MSLVINIAKSDLAKDKMFRLWGNSHGGVYIPPINKTPPNPYLKHIPDRDLITSKCKKLTLINPAYTGIVVNPDTSISPLSVKSLIFCEKYFNLIPEKPFVSRDCERFYFNPTYIL